MDPEAQEQSAAAAASRAPRRRMLVPALAGCAMFFAAAALSPNVSWHEHLQLGATPSAEGYGCQGTPSPSPADFMYGQAIPTPCPSATTDDASDPAQPATTDDLGTPELQPAEDDAAPAPALLAATTTLAAEIASTCNGVPCQTCHSRTTKGESSCKQAKECEWRSSDSTCLSRKAGSGSS